MYTEAVPTESSLNAPEMAGRELLVSGPDAVTLEELRAAFQMDLRAPFAELDPLEESKQQILQQLQRDLAEHAKSKNWVKAYQGGRAVGYNEINNAYQLSKSRNEFLTKGEILTDGEWGVTYNLDSTVDSDLRRDYMVESAKRELRKLLDQQILAEKLGNAHTDSGKRKAYSARDQEPDESHAGLIAEQLVRNLLKKLCIDSEAGFAVQEASIEQDVEHKIDFIIHRNAKNRGVGVKASKELADIGVQFTLNETPENLAHKTSQIQKVKQRLPEGSTLSDIVLVSMPMRDVLDLVKRWRKDLKPGGPDKLWNKEKKEALMREVLFKLLPPEEIDRICKAL